MELEATMTGTTPALFVAAIMTIGVSAAHSSNCGDIAIGNNNWNPNNLCHAEGPGIPAGVCNPGE